jgi:hypothetical protein
MDRTCHWCGSRYTEEGGSGPLLPCCPDCSVSISESVYGWG